jgi:hypothetical protein
MADALSPLQIARLRKGTLWNERSSWIEQWREISEYQQPRLGRFLVGDRNKGGKRHNAIYDNAALQASRTLAAGMMSGMTSPARPWFRLSLADKDLLEYAPVKVWLHEAASVMRQIFNRSNTYRALHQGYEELGLFGTWATLLLEDANTVIHHYPLTVGEYALGTDSKGAVNALAREYQMTVGQMVQEFGVNKVSPTVKNLYDRHAVDQWVTVNHVIEPRKERDPSKRDAQNMPWKSVYFEDGGNADQGFLRDSGFEKFKVLAPRWAVTGQDVYGSSPGQEALGDVKQLQHQQLRKSQGIDYQTNPPLVVPTSYKDSARSRLPGGVMYVDNPGGSAGVRSAFEAPLRLDFLLADIQDVRDRIRGAYYADLFMMLANDTRSGVTATEVAERHEEKMLMLGPVLERLHNELLSPKIDLTFASALKMGALPKAPPELQGMDLDVEFISTLAQAQRMVAAGGLDRLLGTVSSVAGIYPEASDKVNIDQAIDDYADMFNVNPSVVRSDEAVAELRAKRAEQQATAGVGAAAGEMAQAAKTLGDTNTEGLRDVMNQFTGYGSPSAVEV